MPSLLKRLAFVGVVEIGGSSRRFGFSFGARLFHRVTDAPSAAMAYLVVMDGKKYTPRTLDELAADPTPVTVLNGPLPPENVGVLVPGRQRSLHAVLCEDV